MKTPSDDLFVLIKSLDIYEKRHFRQAAKGKREPAGYLLLFDTLDGMESYEEKELLILLKSKGGPTQLKRIKSYLHESIDQFLETYHCNSSVEIQVHRLLQRIEVYYTKKLYDQVRKMIRKAESLVRAIEDYPLLLSVLNWKRRIIMIGTDPEELDEYLAVFHQEERDALLHYRNVTDYMEIQVKLMRISIQGLTAMSEENKNALQELLLHPLLGTESQALSLKAKALYHYSLSSIYIFLPGKINLAYEHLQKTFALLESKSLQNCEIGKLYFLLYTNLGYLLNHLNRNEELLNHIEKLEQFMEDHAPDIPNEHTLVRAYLTLMINHVSWLMEEGRIKEGLAWSKKITAKTDWREGKTAFVIANTNATLLHFMAGEYKLALACINTVLTHKLGGLQDGISHDMEFMKLLIHHELDNTELLLSMCMSLRRQVKKGTTAPKFESLLLGFFSKILPKTNDKKERIQAFLQLHEEFKSHAPAKRNTPAERWFYDFLMDWTASRARNCTMEDIVKERKKKGV
jgi:hypothetical protein